MWGAGGGPVSKAQCPHGAQPSGTGMEGDGVGTLQMELVVPGAAVPPRPSVWDQSTSHPEGCCGLRCRVGAALYLWLQ